MPCGTAACISFPPIRQCFGGRLAIVIENLETAFTPGYIPRFPELDAQRQWMDWYEGRYQTLFPAASTLNGIALLDQKRPLNIPLFRMTSDFIAQAALAQMPAFSSPEPAILEWVDENFYAIERALRRAIWHWSVFDVAVLITRANGTVEAVNPLNYYRVGAVESPDELVGHILAFPYTERTPEQQLLPNQQLTHNRIKVVKLLNGQAMEQVFAYTPETVGQPITPGMASDITAICVTGNWQSWYSGVKDTAAALITAISVQALQLNLYANRPVYRSQQLAAQMDERTLKMPGQEQLSMQQLSEQFDRLVRPVLLISEGIDPPAESIYSEDFQSRNDFTQEMWETFARIVGLPQWGIGRNASGYSRERAADSASVRVRSEWNDLSNCLPKLARGMGCPDGKLSVNWTAPPFQSREQHADEIIALFDKGIISMPEARRSLGWATSDEALEELRSEMGPQQQANNQQEGGREQPEPPQGGNNAGNA